MASSKTLSDPFNFHTVCMEIAKEANVNELVRLAQLKQFKYLYLFISLSISACLFICTVNQ